MKRKDKISKDLINNSMKTFLKETKKMKYLFNQLKIRFKTQYCAKLMPTKKNRVNLFKEFIYPRCKIKILERRKRMISE